MNNHSASSEENPKRKLPRREFLANLLFAGTALTVTALHQEYGLVARRDPKDDGWELPDDDETAADHDGWDIPKDLLDPPPRPKPQPRPKPRPQPPGGMRPPHIRGRVRPPEPPLKGDVKAPKP